VLLFTIAIPTWQSKPQKLMMLDHVIFEIPGRSVTLVNGDGLFLMLYLLNWFW
jgi:hypothetical protein